MSDSPVTLRNVFELPEPGAPEASPDGWKAFQEKIGKEVKGIKTASMPDLTAKFGELFDIPIPNIFLTSWKKADAMQSLLEESKKTPETVMDLYLAEHTINSQHKPSIEVKIQGASVKKIEFTVKLAFALKGFTVKIQNGAFKEIETGACEAKGTAEYEGLQILEKKLAPIKLPLSIPIHESGTHEGETHESEGPESESQRQQIIV